jgi:NADH:ubiquinone oxidoreductase subunit
LPHRGNLTGTPGAVRPKGSTLRRGRRQATGGDYQAWTPGG